MRVLMALTHTKNLVKFGWSICLRPNFSGFLKLWNYPKKWASRIQKSEKVWSQTYTSPKLNQIFCVSQGHRDTHFAGFRSVLAQLVKKLWHFSGFCKKPRFFQKIFIFVLISARIELQSMLNTLNACLNEPDNKLEALWGLRSIFRVLKTVKALNFFVNLAP